MANKWFGDLEVTPKDIEIWHAKEGKFCSGCVEGKLKEHARKTSTKPLTATKSGENGVADLMFIESFGKTYGVLENLDDRPTSLPLE